MDGSCGTPGSTVRDPSIQLCTPLGRLQPWSWPQTSRGTPATGPPQPCSQPWQASAVPPPGWHQLQDTSASYPWVWPHSLLERYQLWDTRDQWVVTRTGITPTPGLHSQSPHSPALPTSTWWPLHKKRPCNQSEQGWTIPLRQSITVKTHHNRGFMQYMSRAPLEHLGLMTGGECMGLRCMGRLLQMVIFPGSGNITNLHNT